MRKLSVYDGDAFAFYKSVIDKKRNQADDPDYKERIVSIDETIRPLFENYDASFENNQLESLSAHGAFTDVQRNDLLRLYSFKSSVLQKLKIQLTTIEFNKVLNTCQSCTIGEVSSFDHLVPKNEFPEFSVNPKNLFPSCHKCNGYKSIAWRGNGARTFLNLFLDDLPQQQYLFAELLNHSNGLVEVNFRLGNVSRLSDNMFELLNSHYTNLHLFQRFKQNSDSVIIPIVNAIRAARSSIDKVGIIDLIKATSRSNQEFFGPNYWRSILEHALADNSAFIDAIYDAR